MPRVLGEMRWTKFAGLVCLTACCLLISEPVLGAQPPVEAEKAKAEAAHETEKAKTEAAHPAAAKPAAADSHAPTAAHGAEHGAAHGGHHDPSDLSHQNAGPKLEDPSQWKSDLALATLVVFLCLLLLLSKFAWRPVMEGLEARERGIAANIEEAKRSAEMAAAQLRQYEAKLAAATEESREILNQARKDADAARERILADAQAIAQRERQRAIEDIQSAKNAALQEMTQKSVDLAVSMAGRLVRRQLKAEDHSQLIREMLDQFPSHN
jgi:F-type H+-transporting ATPase subunit b